MKITILSILVALASCSKSIKPKDAGIEKANPDQVEEIVRSLEASVATVTSPSGNEVEGVVNVDFGTILNSESKALRATIRNNSTAGERIVSVAKVDSADNYFMQQTTGCNNIGPKSSCDIRMTFNGKASPQNEGGRYSGQWVINFSDNTSKTIQMNIQVNLQVPSSPTEIAAQQAAQLANLSFTPVSLDFDEIMETQSKTLSVTIRNNNNVPVSFLSSVQAPYSLVTGCSNISAKGTCTARVSLIGAGKEGNQSGFFKYGPLNSEREVPLSGVVKTTAQVIASTPLIQNITSSVELIDFGTINRKGISAKIVTFRNNSNLPINLPTVLSSTDYRIISDSCNNKQVAIKSSCSVRIFLRGAGKPAGPLASATLSYGNKSIPLSGEIIPASEGSSGLEDNLLCSQLTAQQLSSSFGINVAQVLGWVLVGANYEYQGGPNGIQGLTPNCFISGCNQFYTQSNSSLTSCTLKACSNLNSGELIAAGFIDDASGSIGYNPQEHLSGTYPNCSLSCPSGFEPDPNNSKRCRFAPVVTSIVDTLIEDIEKNIIIPYAVINGEPATSCSVTGLVSSTISTPCSCLEGSCSVGITGVENFYGSDSFSYTVTVGGVISNTGTGSLSITPVDDAPITGTISASFNEDESVLINLNYNDIEGDLATSCLISNLGAGITASPCSCSDGVCSILVTGELDYYGETGLDYTVTANGLISNNSSISITVVSVIDPPILSYSGDQRSVWHTNKSVSYSPTSLYSDTAEETICTVLPELPVGLSLDESDCSIVGMSTASVSRETYSITATNSAGTSVQELEFEIASPWVTMASMNHVRVDHTLLRLNNGKIIAIGGTNSRSSVPYAHAEIYDPSTNTWTMTSAMNSGRRNTQGVVLDNGKILVVGGIVGTTIRSDTNSAEIYDPSTNTWTATTSYPEVIQQLGMVKLADGRVYTSGGTEARSPNGCSSCTVFTSRLTSYIFNPSNNTWTRIADLTQSALLHKPILLNDGAVFTATNSLSEIYVAETNSRTVTATPTLIKSSTKPFFIDSDNILFVGASDGAEIYTVSTNSWSESTGYLGEINSQSTQANGKVYIFGGRTSGTTPTYVNKASVFDPGTSSWSVIDSVPLNGVFRVETLSDGRIILAGGELDSATYSNATFIYNPEK